MRCFAATRPITKALCRSINMDERFQITEKNILLVATAAPAISYWLSYLFKFGYCERLNIPFDFIDVGITDILFFIFILISFYVFSSVASEAFHDIARGVPEIVKSKARLTFFPAILMGVYIFVFGFSGVEAIFAGGFIVSLIFIYEFIVPIFSSKRGISYVEKLERHQVEDFKYDSKNDKFVGKIGFDNYKLLFALAKLSVLSLFLGSFYAYTKSEFIVSENEIVLMKYKDYFVTAKYDSVTNSYEPSISLIEIEKFTNFSYKKIKDLKSK